MQLQTSICFKNYWICLYSVCRPQSWRTSMTPIGVIIKRFEPPNKGVYNRLYAAVFRCMNPFIYCFWHISLHIYHMIYGPICQRQVSWTHNLHYVWDLITHPCRRCLLLAILRVPDKQFTQTSGLIKSVTSWFIASFHDNGGIREYEAHPGLLNVQKTSVCWVRYGYALSGLNRLSPR